VRLHHVILPSGREAIQAKRPCLATRPAQASMATRLRRLAQARTAAARGTRAKRTKSRVGGKWRGGPCPFRRKAWGGERYQAIPLGPKMLIRYDASLDAEACDALRAQIAGDEVARATIGARTGLSASKAPRDRGGRPSPARPPQECRGRDRSSFARQRLESAHVYADAPRTFSLASGPWQPRAQRRRRGSIAVQP
jgi:hypothetical protein